MEHTLEQGNILSPCSNDDEQEIADCQYATEDELDPLPAPGMQSQKTREAANDEQKVSDSSHQCNRQIGPVKVSGVEKYPPLLHAGPDKSGDEEVDVVPEEADQASGAQSPGAVPAGQNEYGNIDQCLQGMEQTDARIQQGRKKQGKEKTPDTEDDEFGNPARLRSLGFHFIVKRGGDSVAHSEKKQDTAGSGGVARVGSCLIKLWLDRSFLYPLPVLSLHPERVWGQICHRARGVTMLRPQLIRR